MPLPNGLALNPVTGQISGTPTVPGTYSFTLRVRDSQGSQRDIPSSIDVTLYVVPTISGSLGTFATRTVAYSGTLGVSGGTLPLVWDVASGTLPTGITLNAATGELSGTPTDVSYTDRPLTIRVTDAVGGTDTYNFTLRYANVLALAGTLADGVVSTAYSDGFDRSGGHTPFVYAITSGSLPAGLSFNTSTGVISGTPTGVSSTSLTIRVTGDDAATTTRSDTLDVASSYVPINVSGAVSSNTQDVETLSAFSITPGYGGVSITGGNGSLTYSWARISGSTAISAGSPSSLATTFVGTVSPGASINATFRLTVADGVSSDTLDVTITVTNIYVTMTLAATLDKATRTVAYSDTLTRTGGKTPITYTVTVGTLPTGITVNASTGALTGTPTDTTYTNRSMTFRATDALGATADASATIEYKNFPTLSYAASFAMRTRSYTISPTQAGGHATLGYAIQTGTLITGMSINAGTGVISGTPTSTSYGVNAVTVRLTDGAANVVDASHSVTYADNLAISGTYGSAGYTGSAYSDSSLSAAGGHGSNVWTVFSGSLPTGVTINSATGALTGTPTVAGAYGFVVRVTDSAGFTADSAAQSITIAAGVSISMASTLDYVFTNAPPNAGPATRNLTTPTLTAVASGGSGGYTYAWARISGDTSIAADSPTATATTFTGTAVPVGNQVSAVFRLTATDSGARSATADVTVSISYESGL